MIPLLEGPAGAVSVFALSYLGIILWKRQKTKLLWAGVLLAFLFGRNLMPLSELVHSINWNVMGIFAGTLVVAELFILSRVPELLADTFVNRSKSVGAALFAIAVMTSLLSAFIENVATVLIVAPIALVISRKLKINPTIFMIGIAVSSNLQGTATLIGDPPSMILAAAMKMDFNDFFFMKGADGIVRPSIFFAVQFGALASYGILWLFFRKHREKPDKVEPIQVSTWTPTWILTLMVLGLALSGLFDPEFRYGAGVISMLAAVGSVLWYRRRDPSETKALLKRYDWDTTFFLAGVFVMVGIVERSGALESLAHYLSGVVGDSPMKAFLAIVWISVALSAVIDNVPYITAMIPVALGMSSVLGIDQNLLVFGLLMGSCLGGNITPVGASANITAMGILRREGYHPGFGEFMKLGLPFTIVATAAGTAFVWWIWS
ncbi:MAG: SLC13 family permease [Candidatus Krumholzibacteria bacterium]|nr:SLC13 family permease [Candidatus Krumholzibacteria bacterium]